MEQSDLNKIGYRRHYYGTNLDSDVKQCFHCKYGQVLEKNREKVQCNRWNMTVDEDDICSYFEFATFWAFDCTDEDTERRRIKLENVKNKSQEGCYIATAVYGGYDKAEVLLLRKYRDNVLKKSPAGRMIIKLYYALSPQLAEKLKRHPWINGWVKRVLDMIVEKL